MANVYFALVNVRSIPAFDNYSTSYRRTFSETNNKFIPSFVKLICLLSFEVCFCRDILPSFCLVWLCTSASNGIRLKNFAVLSHTNLKFLPLVWLANLCLLTSLLKTKIHKMLPYRGPCRSWVRACMTYFA